MRAAEDTPMTTAAERHRIERELAALQALVTAIPPGGSLNFRAIHAVASRLTQAAYEGWKKEALAATAPTSPPKPERVPADRRR